MSLGPLLLRCDLFLHSPSRSFPVLGWAIAIFIEGGDIKVKNDNYKCFFCGSDEIKIPVVSIFLAMGGDEYSFCEQCLNGMTADEFWEEFFKANGHGYPPRLADWAQKAWDDGITLNEARYPSTKTNPKSISNKTSSKIKERGKMSNALRYKIMRRDNFHCILCGATGKDDKLVVDHIIPISKGGKTITQNLRTTCEKCNGGKGVKIEGK